MDLSISSGPTDDLNVSTKPKTVAEKNSVANNVDQMAHKNVGQEFDSNKTFGK